MKFIILTMIWGIWLQLPTSVEANNNWTSSIIFEADSGSSVNYSPCINISKDHEINIIYNFETDSNIILSFRKSQDNGITFLPEVKVAEYTKFESSYEGCIPAFIKYDDNGDINIFYHFYHFYDIPDYFLKWRKSTDGGLTFSVDLMNINVVSWSSFINYGSEAKYLYIQKQISGELQIKKSENGFYNFIDSLILNRGSLIPFSTYPFSLVRIGKDSLLAFWHGVSSPEAPAKLYYNRIDNFQSISSPVAIDTSIISFNSHSVAKSQNHIFVSFLGFDENKRSLYFTHSEDNGILFHDSKILYTHSIDPMAALINPIIYHEKFGLFILVNKYSRGISLLTSTNLGNTFVESVIDSTHQYLLGQNTIAIDSSGNIFVTAMDIATPRTVKLFTTQIINTIRVRGKIEDSMEFVAFPNPFNQQIKFQINPSNPSRIKVNIYNIRGQLINQLYDGPVNSTGISLTWNGTNRYQNPVSSGLYFVNITNEKSSQIGKILYIK